MGEAPKPVLGDREACLWYLRTDACPLPQLAQGYEELLCEEERARYHRLTRESVRNEYLLTRALVRTVLSRHAENEPHAWRFALNPYGKPEIIPQDGLPPLSFNLSHTDGLITCLVALRRRVGVDVEDVTRATMTPEMIPFFCSEEDRAALHSMPWEEQRTRLLEYWTLKEAYAKARGLGVSLPFDRFTAHLAPDGTPSLSLPAGFEDDPRAWQFTQLRLSSRHLVAVAIEREPGTTVALTLRETVPLVF